MSLKERLKIWYDNEKRLSLLQRTAKEIRSYAVQKKVLGTLLACLVALTSILYITAALYKNTGSFTVGIDKVDLSKYGISLSETRDMQFASSHLNAKINEKITNISEEDLPENLDMIDGEHNGLDYIAYTFYLKNYGEIDISFEYELTISNITKGIDDAVRVRLYTNGEYVNYAKTASDGSGPEPGTTEFYSSGIVTKGRIDNLSIGEMVRYTVVIWLEGDDPDCVDRVLDGLAKFEMNFDVVH